VNSNQDTRTLLHRALVGELRVESLFAQVDAVERAVEVARRRADAKRLTKPFSPAPFAASTGVC